jgi:hypothetical protein
MLPALPDMCVFWSCISTSDVYGAASMHSLRKVKVTNSSLRTADHSVGVLLTGLYRGHF